jgi:hypothetical protein
MNRLADFAISKGHLELAEKIRAASFKRIELPVQVFLEAHRAAAKLLKTLLEKETDPDKITLISAALWCLSGVEMGKKAIEEAVKEDDGRHDLQAQGQNLGVSDRRREERTGEANSSDKGELPDEAGSRRRKNPSPRKTPKQK